MDQSHQWRSLILAVVILAAFLGAVSMNMDRLRGWSFIVVCVVAVVLGAVGYIWARERVLPAWEQLPRAGRFLLVALTAAIVLGGRLIVNRHKPNEALADVLAGIGVLVALALFALHRIMFRRLNSGDARVSKR